MNALLLVPAAIAVGCQTGDATSKRAPQPVPPALASAAKVVEAPDHAAVTTMVLAPIDAPPAASDVAPPFSLTASDGSGLLLTRVDAKAVVQGPLAFTELHLYFHNPESRTREGTFAITLPAHAAVSRFAKERNGQWQEAEVVEKAVARRAYDDFLHRKQDPALLEKAAGNQFTAKVFPIPANSDQQLIVSFSQELPGRGYVLPLRGLPKTDRVDVQLTATTTDGKTITQSIDKVDWQPDTDFAASVPAVPAAVSSGGIVVGAVAIGSENAGSASPPTELTMLVDTSASRALGFARYVSSVHQLVSSLAAKYGSVLKLQVIAFDQDTQRVFDGVAGSYGDADDKTLLARGAAGASDLAQAITQLGKPYRRVVIVTDGVMTAGPETPELVAAIKKLPIDRVDVVLAGGIRDEHVATTLARPGLPRPGDVFDLDRGADSVAAGLGEPVVADVPVQVAGASWFYPKTISALRPGNMVLVFARMDRPSQAINVYLGNESHTLGTLAATPALVERAAASAEITELEDTLDATIDTTVIKTLRDKIAKRSVEARLISSQTSMLVLENDSDYARYKIDRTSLADILVVGPNGLEQQHRTMIASATPPAPTTTTTQPQLARDQAVREAHNAGVLGSSASQQGGAFASLTGTGDVSSGFDDTNVYGGLLGNEAGEMNGGFGYGRAGFGPGGGGASGGGTGWGTIGTGRYGTVTHDSGTGAGYGVGGGRGGMRGRSAAVPTVSIGQPTVDGPLDRAIVRRYIKRNIQKITYCYERELLSIPGLQGTVTASFVIDETGHVPSSSASGVHDHVSSCIANVIKEIEFPHPAGTMQVRYPFVFRPAGDDDYVAPAPRTGQPPDVSDVSDAGDDEKPGLALTGKLADVVRAIKSGSADKALVLASKWHDETPGDVLALIALGEALEANKNPTQAARIYGSIIDLFPSRADMRRFAGERLERLGDSTRWLAVDTYRRAVADRPDHANGHRLLAYALLGNHDYAGAFDAILAGVDQKYPEGRFLGVDRILGEDAGMIAAVYLANGGNRAAIDTKLAKRDLKLATSPSTRFLMYWETDANDVDFHIRDSQGGHAWYESKALPSGGELYADVTTGYGPECFAIPGKPTAGPYKLSINYYSQGPMGYGMGLLQIQRFDGKSITIEDRPYVIMTDRAFVDLGTFL